MATVDFSADYVTEAEVLAALDKWRVAIEFIDDLSLKLDITNRVIYKKSNFLSERPNLISWMKQPKWADNAHYCLDDAMRELHELETTRRRNAETDLDFDSTYCAGSGVEYALRA